MESFFFSSEAEAGSAPMCVCPVSISDHYPIHMKVCMYSTIDNRGMRRYNGCFKLNTSLIKEEDNLEAIQMVTSLCKFCTPGLRPRVMWNFLVESWRAAFHIIDKKRAIDRRSEELELQSKLSYTEKELQSKGSDPGLEEQLVRVKCQSRKIQQYKITKINWMKEGDQGTKLFFNIIRAKHKRDLIEGTQINGDLSSDPILPTVSLAFLNTIPEFKVLISDLSLSRALLKILLIFSTFSFNGI